MDMAAAIIAGILGTIAALGFILASPTRRGVFRLDMVGYVGLPFTAGQGLARLLQGNRIKTCMSFSDPLGTLPPLSTKPKLA